MYRELAENFFNTIQSVACKEHQKHISAMLKGERFVMMYLLKNGASFPGRIAADMGSSTANIAKILRNLEERDLIKRQEDVHDKRKKKVYLSENGRKMILNEAGQVQNYVTKLFEKMGMEDSKELVRLLKRIAQITKEIEEKDE